VGKYALRRVALLIPTVIGTSILIFLMLRLLPGDVVDLMTAGNKDITDDAKQKLRAAFALTDPLPVQYVKWIGNLLRGDPRTSSPHASSVRATGT
jgi:ABC-type dipeptide/oligopeptide/nickel transport system permease component